MQTETRAAAKAGLVAGLLYLVLANCIDFVLSPVFNRIGYFLFLERHLENEYGFVLSHEFVRMLFLIGLLVLILLSGVMGALLGMAFVKLKLRSRSPFRSIYITSIFYFLTIVLIFSLTVSFNFPPTALGLSLLPSILAAVAIDACIFAHLLNRWAFA